MLGDKFRDTSIPRIDPLYLTLVGVGHHRRGKLKFFSSKSSKDGTIVVCKIVDVFPVLFPPFPLGFSISIRDRRIMDNLVMAASDIVLFLL